MNRQFPGRDLHPLVICAFVAHQDVVVNQEIVRPVITYQYFWPVAHMEWTLFGVFDSITIFGIISNQSQFPVEDLLALSTYVSFINH